LNSKSPFHTEKSLPLPKREARKQYEQSCHLGRRHKDVEAFVRAAVKGPKSNSVLSKYEEVEETQRLKPVEIANPDGIVKASFRLLMEKRTREDVYERYIHQS
jgi:glycine cleavage system aminomethyltransferase T